MEWNVGAASYLAGAIAFVVLTAVLLLGWRGRRHGGLLALACALTAVWAALHASHALLRSPLVAAYLAEVVRDGAWFAFLLSQLPATAGTARSGWVGRIRIGLYATCMAVGLGFLVVPRTWGAGLLLFGMVVLPVAGLILVEQLYRNSPLERRWNIKYLCLGVGGLFAYDFFLYTDALLFQRIEGVLWSARGVVAAVTTPFIAVAAARNPAWDLDVYVSRRAVFHSATLLVAGVYLLLMAAAGYYVRLVGGEWGDVLQTAFIFGALLALVALLVSGQLRGRLRVFLNRHFFNYKYDYRDEWLRFNRTLAGVQTGEPVLERAIRSIAQLVESQEGVLWSVIERDEFEPVAALNRPIPGGRISTDTDLVGLLARTGWVLDLQHPDRLPAGEFCPALPAALAEVRDPWLVVPLSMGERLVGLVVICRPRTPQQLNWEDYDLLKVTGAQAASLVAQVEAGEALARARQFEAFNQMSAFVVHDLKNLVAQLSLLVTNAGHHRDNPEFVDDMVATTRSAVARMNRLLGQLRDGGCDTTVRRFDLRAVVESAVSERAHVAPVPEFLEVESGLEVEADPQRFAAIVVHLIQNAQEATPREGHVRLTLSALDGHARLIVEDSGCGMSADFIRERLFRPFDSTKGLAGMGIGVYESREFIRKLGGRIEVESEPGRGTRFCIDVPLAARAMESEKIGVQA